MTCQRLRCGSDRGEVTDAEFATWPASFWLKREQHFQPRVTRKQGKQFGHAGQANIVWKRRPGIAHRIEMNDINVASVLGSIRHRRRDAALRLRSNASNI